MTLPLALAAGFVVCAMSMPRAEAAGLSGNAAFTSDYVWRGTTQTQGDAAVQAGARLTGASGWYGSIWASNVELAPETHASSEFDFAAGWSGAVSDNMMLDVNLTHYRCPSTTVDLDWTELNAIATYAQNYWLDEVLDDSYSHGQLSGVWAFKAPFELRLSAHGTDSADRRLFPDLVGSRIEAALQASF